MVTRKAPPDNLVIPDTRDRLTLRQPAQIRGKHLLGSEMGQYIVIDKIGYAKMLHCICGGEVSMLVGEQRMAEFVDEHEGCTALLYEDEEERTA
jgi:hypothetical protein